MVEKKWIQKTENKISKLKIHNIDEIKEACKYSDISSIQIMYWINKNKSTIRYIYLVKLRLTKKKILKWMRNDRFNKEITITQTADSHS